MYTVAVRRKFTAYHYLTGGNWGAENERHMHHYQIELQLQGDELDKHGFLVDIMDIEQALDAQVARYRNQTLNGMAEFAGLNPSIEHFSRILCQPLAAHIQSENIHRITVRLWENELAWASYSCSKEYCDDVEQQ